MLALVTILIQIVSVSVSISISVSVSISVLVVLTEAAHQHTHIVSMCCELVVHKAKHCLVAPEVVYILFIQLQLFASIDIPRSAVKTAATQIDPVPLSVDHTQRAKHLTGAHNIHTMDRTLDYQLSQRLIVRSEVVVNQIRSTATTTRADRDCCYFILLLVYCWFPVSYCTSTSTSS